MWYERTELTEVPVTGTGISVLQNLTEVPGAGMKCPTELTEVLCRVIPGVKIYKSTNKKVGLNRFDFKGFLRYYGLYVTIVIPQYLVQNTTMQF